MLDRLFIRVKIAMDKLNEDRGIGVVEMILILVVLIALVLIFKTQMTDLVNSIFKTITKQAGNV